MRVMVTGATGYVGAFSVKALIDAGHRVRLLVRDRDKAARMLRAIGVAGRLDCVQGDMTDERSVLAALAGCNAALHCAAVVSTHGSRGHDMLRDNPRGTELVVGHAVRRGLDPVVHCSSVTALLNPGAKELTADMPPGTLTHGYARSKVLCERYVRDLQQQGAPVVVTYPGSVTGPAAGGVLGEPTIGLAALLALGLMPAGQATMTFIDARDLGALHAALMVADQGPRRFMCGGHCLSAAQVAQQLQRLTGRAIRVLNLPTPLLLGAGRVSDALARVLPRRDNQLTHEAMTYLTQMVPTRDEAVRRELGIRYRAVTETLRESLLAAREAGLLDDAQIGRLARRSRRA